MPFTARAQTNPGFWDILAMYTATVPSGTCSGSGGHLLIGLTGAGSFGSSAEGIDVSCPLTQEKLRRRDKPLTIVTKLSNTLCLLISSLTCVVSSNTLREIGVIGSSRPRRAATVLIILPVSKNHRTGCLPDARDLAFRMPFPRNDGTGPSRFVSLLAHWKT